MKRYRQPLAMQIYEHFSRTSSFLPKSHITQIRHKNRNRNIIVRRWQVTGSVKITEFASVNDEDEYLFEVTTDLEKQKYGPLLAAIERLKPDFLKQLRVYVKELNAL